MDEVFPQILETFGQQKMSTNFSVFSMVRTLAILRDNSYTYTSNLYSQDMDNLPVHKIHVQNRMEKSKALKHLHFSMYKEGYQFPLF